VVTWTEDNMGGEWEQEGRRLYIEAEGWIRGHHVPTAIHSVRNYAKLADTLGNYGAFHQLHQALSKLELEIERYEHRMATFREQVGLLHALVLRARDEAPTESQQRSEWAIIGPDEDEETWLKRNENLYKRPR